MIMKRRYGDDNEKVNYSYINSYITSFYDHGGGHLSLLKLLQIEHHRLIKSLRSVLTGQWE